MGWGLCRRRQPGCSEIADFTSISLVTHRCGSFELAIPVRATSPHHPGRRKFSHQMRLQPSYWPRNRVERGHRRSFFWAQDGLDVPMPVEHPDDFDAVLNRTVEDEMLLEAAHPPNADSGQSGIR